MPSAALYTDAGKIIAALAFQSPETLSQAISAGATSITLNQNAPTDWQAGSSLVLDSGNPTLRETVTITGAPSGAIVPISTTVNAHVLGCPVMNATLVANYPAAASRYFDSLTWNNAGFAYESWTDLKSGYFDNRGYIVVPLSKPLVKIADVTSVTFQPTPMYPADILDLTKAWIRDGYFLEVTPANYYNLREGLATVVYKGGYNPLPDDIAWAVTVIAARMYKERDSGYSDTIGSQEMGTLTYKKALPADVVAVVNRYKRWTE